MRMEDVVALATKFGIPLNDEPGMIDPLMLLQRRGLWNEEVIELNGATDQLLIEPTVEASEDWLDAAVDTVYSIMVTAASFGFDFTEAFRRVHEANMRKERAVNADNKRGSQYDIVKPQGWEPPSHTDLVFQPTVRDLLCESSGLTSALSSPTPSEPISIVELERYFQELRGLLPGSGDHSLSKTSDTPDINSDNSSGTTSSESPTPLPLHYGRNGLVRESMEALVSHVSHTLLKDESRESSISRERLNGHQ